MCHDKSFSHKMFTKLTCYCRPHFNISHFYWITKKQQQNKPQENRAT